METLAYIILSCALIGGLWNFVEEITTIIKAIKNRKGE